MSKLLKEHGFSEEVIELARDNKGNSVLGPTGYPEPIKRYRFVLEDFGKSAEEIYYSIHDLISVGEGFPHVRKITDIFAASENSSFFGNAQQRLGLQQEKVSMFLATIGKMVKELFQIVRELRIIDERVGYYKDSFDANSRTRESAEIVLKGIWVDQVEGGAKNPASVYGMARELQFTTLPDLFYSIHPPSISKVDSTVNALDFNQKIKEVLKRKLRTFMQWKDSTYREIINRRIFTLKYLRQHFNVIKMYVSWVKPYLRNLRRLQMPDYTGSSDLINAFEGSIIEIENVFFKLPPSHGEGKYFVHNKHIHSVVIISFRYRVKPSMNYQSEYQRGPLHVGQSDVSLRAYTWDKKTIDKYIQMREKEDMELLGSIDGSVKAAMESLGEELERYLKEAGDDTSDFQGSKKVDMEKEHEKKKKEALRRSDPFVGLIFGFKELLFDPLAGSIGKKKDENGNPLPNRALIINETEIAKKNVVRATWQVYKNFKKGNGMLAW